MPSSKRRKKWNEMKRNDEQIQRGAGIFSVDEELIDEKRETDRQTDGQTGRERKPEQIDIESISPIDSSLLVIISIWSFVTNSAKTMHEKTHTKTKVRGKELNIPYSAYAPSNFEAFQNLTSADKKRLHAVGIFCGIHLHLHFIVRLTAMMMYTMYIVQNVAVANLAIFLVILFSAFSDTYL